MPDNESSSQRARAELSAGSLGSVKPLLKWGAAGLALGLAGFSVMVSAQRGPESLLPPGFDEPPAAPAKPAKPASAPAEGGAADADPGQPRESAGGGGGGGAAPVRSGGGAVAVAAGGAGISDEELLRAIDPSLLKQLVEASRPRYDVPPQDQRSLAVVGALSEEDGGLPALSSRNLNGEFVSGLLARFKGPVVSRWGQILLRRALVSRLATPIGMNGADWAGLRAQVLLKLGEADAARLLVSSVDNADYTPGLEDAAMDSFLATADPIGLCPVTQLTAAGREGWQWDLTRAVCGAFTRNDPNSINRANRFVKDGGAAQVDVLLAQKFAGVAGNKRRAVKIEWDGVNQLNNWRFGYALATGLEPPKGLIDAAPQYWLYAARAPMLPLATRATAADRAAARGVLSSAAAVDLFSAIYAEGENGSPGGKLAEQLRAAYVAPTQAERVAAMRGLWGDGKDPVLGHSRSVLTAYAAARIVPSDDLADDAPALIGAMLTAGLDRNAMGWAGHVASGSLGWGLLACAVPTWNGAGAAGGLTTFRSKDTSADSRRSAFLLAGLMGLERIGSGDATSFAERLGVDMARQTRWTRAIDDAAASGNPALVALLAGFGMQGATWQAMTPVHLLHIVGALHKVGLDAEARMIAAEAVARA